MFVMVEKKTYQPEILLIQEDPFLSDIYKKKFEMEGFRTTVAVGAESCLEILKKKQPSIILLDVQMSKIDGFELLREIKERRRTRNIPVVLLTGVGQKEDVERGFALGAEDYVIKTHNKPSETLNIVKRILHLT
jgi:PleD family two-component response regulator